MRLCGCCALVPLLAACGPKESPATPQTTVVVTAPTAVVSHSAAPPPAGTKMVLIPGGKFKMGRDDGKSDEGPAHEITVKPFYLDVNEVTLEEFEACVKARKCPAPRSSDSEKEFCNAGKADRAKQPINCIGFKMAEAYCAFVGKRLPSEEEWERAARGDDGRHYPWGDDPPNQDRLCFGRLAEKLGTCDVGSHPKGVSPYGVHDMAGNVSEWTSSPICSYAEPGCTSPDRVARGGSWDYRNPANLSTTHRWIGDANTAKDLVGVRCAKDQ